MKCCTAMDDVEFPARGSPSRSSCDEEGAPVFNETNSQF